MKIGFGSSYYSFDEDDYPNDITINLDSRDEFLIGHSLEELDRASRLLGNRCNRFMIDIEWTLDLIKPLLGHMCPPRTNEQAPCFFCVEWIRLRRSIKYFETIQYYSAFYGKIPSYESKEDRRNMLELLRKNYRIAVDMHNFSDRVNYFWLHGKTFPLPDESEISDD